MRIKVDGVSINLAPYGPAPGAGTPAVLFMHGAGMDRSVWALQAPYLGGKGFTAMAVDLPGHGGSGGEVLSSIEVQAGFVWRLADALGIERLSLVGHSMGALAALEAASLQPARTNRLALLGAALALPVNAALLGAARDRPAEAAALIARWGLGRRGSRGGGGIIGGSLDGAVRALLATATPGLLHTDLAACSTYAGGREAALRIACPALVLIGAEDRMAPPRQGRALAEAVKGATAATIPHAGHMLMLEAPSAVSAALLRFLKAAPECRPDPPVS